MSSDRVVTDPPDRSIRDWLTYRGFWTANVAGWSFVAVLVGGVRYLALRDKGESLGVILGAAVIWSGIGLCLSGGLARTYRASIGDHPHPARLALSVFVACLIAAAIWTGVMAGVESLVYLGPQQEANAVVRYLGGVLIGMFVLGAWSGTFLSSVLWERARAAKEAALESGAVAHRTRLELLRAQLNPHFLFNSLNSVNALIDEDPSRAQQMVRDLAALLRRVLESERTQGQTVADEIQFVRLYLRCEGVRFESRLATTVEVDHALLPMAMPSLLLQPLVENAIKHGDMEGTLNVSVTGKLVGERIHLEIRNTGRLDVPEADVRERPGLGIRNVRERLENLYPADHIFQLEQDGDEVVARIEYAP